MMTPNESPKGPSPKPTVPSVKVYILRVRLPTGKNIKKRQERGDYRETLTYEFDVRLRRSIRKLRRHYRYLAYRHSIKFHGLHLVREEDLAPVETFVNRANNEFKALAPSLSVQAVSIPLDLDPSRKGDLSEAVVNAVRAHVYGRVYERLQKLSKRSGDLPENSRRALLKMTRDLEKWNLLGSKDVSEKLAEMAQKFSVKVVGPVMDDLEVELKKVSSEGAFVEV